MYLNPPNINNDKIFKKVNWVGVYTFYVKEILRFMNVPMQTILSPVVSTLLFLTIFNLALKKRSVVAEDVIFIDFLAAGLIIMSAMQNSFANTSSSLLHSKILGNFSDILAAPLNTTEIIISYLSGGVTRGIIVAILSTMIMILFMEKTNIQYLYLIFYLLNACIMTSTIGIIGAIWAQKFDHMASFTNFFITPLTFLSGTFYSISNLPEIWQKIAFFNPFFYLIDGFRFSLIGYSDGFVKYSMIIVPSINVILIISAIAIFASGWKIKT